MSCAFPAELGARLRRSVGCPEGARQTRVSNRCSSIAWAAGPPQRCTPVQQALILPVLRFTALLRQSRFCLSYAFPAGLGGTTAQAGKSKLFSRWLDIFAVWHIMKVAKGNWLESSFAHQKRTPSECESEGVLFGLTYPCGGCQATCRCSTKLHSLRQSRGNC